MAYYIRPTSKLPLKCHPYILSRISYRESLSAWDEDGQYMQTRLESKFSLQISFLRWQAPYIVQPLFPESRFWNCLLFHIDPLSPDLSNPAFLILAFLETHVTVYGKFGSNDAA